MCLIMKIQFTKHLYANRYGERANNVKNINKIHLSAPENYRSKINCGVPGKQFMLKNPKKYFILIIINLYYQYMTFTRSNIPTV